MTDKRYKITYTDAEGRSTERVISNPTFIGPLVKCMCELRGATRTFRRDRVQSVIDMETGEILEDNK